MKLPEIRSLVLQSFITKNLLDQSVYPELELVCALMLQDYGQYNINSSLIDASYFVKDGDPASATKFNKLQDLAQIDIATLYNFVDYLNNYLEDSYNSSIQKMTGLDRIAVALNDELNSLKLANSDVDQGVEVFGTDFSNLSTIDFANTNASINVSGRYASAGESSTTRLVPFIDKALDITPTVITNGIIKVTYDIKNSPYNIKIKTPITFNNEAEVKIDISFKENLDLSRFYMKFFDSNSYSVKLYCVVGKTYVTLSGAKACKDFFDVDFNKVTTSNIIIYIKTADNYGLDTEKEFNISFGDMKAGVVTYLVNSILQTIPLEAVKSFTSVALIADEELRDGSDITWSISTGKASTWSSFTNIEPINGDKIDLSKVYSVLGVLTPTKTEGVIDLLKTHRYIYSNNYCTDFTTNSIASIGMLNYKMLRGVDRTFRIPEYDITSVYFYVDDTSVVLDFATYPGTLDSTMVSAAMTLPRGFYAFRFSSSSDIDSYIDYFKTITHLYFGSHVATYVPIEKFITEVEDDDYTKFSFVEDTDYQALVKGLLDDPTKEEVLMVENDLTQAPNKIILRATFLSDTNTAVLKGFKIKLG